ncbi:MAG: ABC transporter substrate-binding protein [Nocardioidaceae bacterium]
MRSRIPFFAATALVTVAAAGCMQAGGGGGGQKDSSTSGQVTLMAYTGIFQDRYTKAVIKPFEKKYPNIDVTYQPSANSAKTLATLRGQRSNPTVDVAIMDVSVSDTGNEEKVLAPLDPKRVPNLKDVAERGKVPGHYGPAVTFDNLVLLYNTDAVKKDPTSWSALWNKKYAGKVAIPAAPDIQGLALTMITDKLEGANYKDTIKPAVQRLSKLAPRVQTWDPNPDSYTMVINGSTDVSIGWNARAQTYHDQSKGKLGVVIPKEGSVFQINTINLVKDSPNSKAAQTFINYALSPTAQAAFTNSMFYAPTNTKTKVSDEALQRTATSPERQKQMIDVDWGLVAKHSDAWTRTWKRKIIGG